MRKEDIENNKYLSDLLKQRITSDLKVTIPVYKRNNFIGLRDVKGSLKEIYRIVYGNYDLEPNEEINENSRPTYIQPYLEKLLSEPFMEKSFYAVLTFTLEAQITDGGISETQLLASMLSYLSKEIGDNITLIDKKLWVKSTKWELLSDQFTENNLVNLFRDIFFITGIHNISITATKNFCKQLAEVCVGSQSDNNILHFNGYYVENGIVKKGVYKQTQPRWMIDCDIEGFENVELNDTVRELFLHLANGQEDAYEFLLDISSMGFLNSREVKAASGKTLYLFGENGGEGKTTLETLLKEVYGFYNTTAVNNVKDLSERAKSVTSLLSLMTDEANYLDNDICRFIKNVTTGDLTQYRDLYKTSKARHPLTQIIMTSNKLLKAEDKTPGFLRRLAILKVDNALVKDSKWWSELRKEEIINNTRLFLIRRSQEIMKRPNYKLSKFVGQEELIEEFMINNDVIKGFIVEEEISVEKIEFMSIKELYLKFKIYLSDLGIENPRNIIQMNNFTNDICSKFGLVKKRTTVNNIIAKRVELQLGVVQNSSVIGYPVGLLEQNKGELKSGFETDGYYIYRVRDNNIDVNIDRDYYYVRKNRRSE